MKFYFKFTLMVICFIGISFFGTLYCLLRWKNPNNNRDVSGFYGRLILKITGIRVSLEGREHLESHQPCVYVANHQSSFDMATYGSIYPHRTLVIGKIELLFIPVFGALFWAAGNILIHRQKKRKAIQALSGAAKAIKEDRNSIWIFPEGTRNGGKDDFLPFKRGAFHLALQSGVPLVPVVCSPLYPFFDWKSRRIHPGVLKVKILPPIQTASFNEKDVDSLLFQVREKMLAAIRAN